MGISLRLDELVSRAPVAAATLAAGFLRFLGFFFPVVATPLLTWHIGRYVFLFTVAQPLAALVVVAVTGVNYLSVRFGGSVQVLLTSLKIATIIVIVLGGMLFARHAVAQAAPLTAPLGFGAISTVLTALVPAMWAYNGFNDLGDLGEEIVQPEKNIPRAIILGLLTVGGLYLLANVVYSRFCRLRNWRNRNTSQPMSCNRSPVLAAPFG